MPRRVVLIHGAATTSRVWRHVVEFSTASTYPAPTGRAAGIWPPRWPRWLGTAVESMLNPPAGAPAFTCTTPINTGEGHYVVDAAEYALNRWVTTGIPPARAPFLQVSTSGSAPSFVLDVNGNVKGGVRTPAVDVPVATLPGLGQSGSSFCFLFGTTIPFSASKLAALYPTHAKFVARWAVRTAADVAAGFVRPADAAELVAAAIHSGVGG